MGNIGSGGVTNIGDYFWGQGPTGPDIQAVRPDRDVGDQRNRLGDLDAPRADR